MEIKILSLEAGEEVGVQAAVGTCDCDCFDCDTDTDHACDCYSGNG